MKALLPQVVRPFDYVHLTEIQTHVTQIRRAFDWPGMPYHDVDAAPGDKFNRWFWHNLPLLMLRHNSPALISLVSEMAGEALKPSYVFLSMYGKDGVCPLHTDRPQCEYTLDMVINQDARWPIYVNDVPYLLNEGDALFYSGTRHPHYRKPMNEEVDVFSRDGAKIEKTPTFCNLAFFHFVPATFAGKRE